MASGRDAGYPGRGGGPRAGDGLLDLGAQVAFRHSLLRSAVYRAAAADERRSAHLALAAATDAETDPDRRAWHRAHATLAPDEDVADELERSAGRAQARGGLAAAAAFLERAAALTPDPGRRARRALYAARAKHLAGAPHEALTLLATAAAGPLGDFDRAMLQRLHGQIALDARRGGDAVPLLVEAARQLEPLDPALARETHLEALRAASIAGRPASARGLPPRPLAGRPPRKGRRVLSTCCSKASPCVSPMVTRPARRRSSGPSARSATKAGVPGKTCAGRGRPAASRRTCSMTMHGMSWAPATCRSHATLARWRCSRWR